MVPARFEIRCNRVKDGRQFGGLAQAAENAMACRCIGDMYKPPFADFHAVAAVLANDARMIAVRAVIFRMNRLMENRPQKFAVPPVHRSRRWGIANLKRIRRFQLESAR